MRVSSQSFLVIFLSILFQACGGGANLPAPIVGGGKGGGGNGRQYPYCNGTQFVRALDYVNLRRTPGMEVSIHKISGVVIPGEILGLLPDSPVVESGRTWLKVESCKKSDDTVAKGWILDTSLEKDEKNVVRGRVITVMPSSGNIADRINGLSPGDTLFLTGGAYLVNQQITINARGSDENKIRIVGDPMNRPILKVDPSSDNVDAVIRIEDASHVQVSGIEIQGERSDGAAIGVEIRDSSNIEISRNKILRVSKGIRVRRKIPVNPGNRHDILILGNQITATGIDNSSGDGIHVGCSDPDPVAPTNSESMQTYLNYCHYKKVRISHNVVHRTGGTRRFGINVERGSQAEIDNNSIWHVNLGILVRFGADIIGNFIRYTQNEAAIQAAGFFKAYSNVAISESVGLQSHPHEGGIPDQIFFCNNTFQGDFSRAVSPHGWDEAGLSQRVVSNAFYVTGGGSVLRGTGRFLQNAVTISNALMPFDLNRWLNLGGTQGGAFSGTHLTKDFEDISKLNAYPSDSSALLGGAAAQCPGASRDFNGVNRYGTFQTQTVGAYQYVGPTNPAISPLLDGKLKTSSTSTAY